LTPILTPTSKITSTFTEKMAKINFFLKESSSNKETIIFLVLNHNYKRLKYSTGEYIHPKEWDFREKSPILSKKFPHCYDIKRRLEEYRYFLTDLIGEYKRRRKEITPQILREKLDAEFKSINPLEHDNEHETVKNKTTLFNYIDEFIKECKEGKRLTPIRKTRYKQWTLKGYTTMNYHLTNYKKAKKIALDFEDITSDFYQDLLAYFNSLQMATNTIGKHIKNIKVIMRAAHEEGLHQNTDYTKKSFRTITEETDAIYLSEDEISRIYNLDLSSKKNNHLERARDLFMIAARTALRFQDVTTIQKHNFTKKGNNYFLVKQTSKTGAKVVIPLKKEVLEIYHKYDGNLPNNLSNQKMNQYIKEVGKMANINEIVTKYTTKGGERTEETKEKWEFITTHSARRSAATNMFLAGIPPISIMKITGHKTERAFLKYIRMSEEDNAYKMAENDYFKNDFVKSLDLENQ